ncbi:serine/threonine protein kinase [Aeromicrobium sp. A1-2]|uniref:protein kinase domain-containing protein n=1 Tax=Aeromicrobium sp. A1-2 TaxID=2107713 RepID=UPI000E4BC240|nr:protein kinase [Aeromicrobium sp. A1-2]AXT85412.1 serine/threonine protein kinase [Aeromicrobium sp. A1-2]
MSRILIGRYRLDRLIGGGGMGEVWQAHDGVLGRTVAIKIIRRHLADDPNVRARLRVEAQLAGSLHHPGIVEVYDYGEDEQDGHSVPFIVMPLIDGAPLSALLAERGTVSTGETMAIVAEIAAALGAAHDAGIVHRDLKPGNILVTPADRVMLVDFGIAHSPGGEPLTQTGALIGTADYLSPEQAAGRSATFASDLYSLGVVAHVCLAGSAPFHRDSDIATALAHIQDEPPGLPDTTPPEAVALVLGLLAKDPADRPSSAAAVVDAARALATSVPRPPGASAASAVPVAVTDRPETHDDTSPGQTSVLLTSDPSRPTGGSLIAAEHSRVPRRLVVLSSALIVLVAVALGWLLVRDDAVVAPDLDGTTQTVATARLKSLGLSVRVDKVDVAGHEAGEVVGQDPKPGEEIASGSTVSIQVASGRVDIPVDDLLGASYETAAARLEELGLRPARVDAPSSAPAGTVSDVAPSTTAKIGGTVTLTVAATAAPVTQSDSTSSKDQKAPTKPKKDKKKGKK